MIHTSNTQGDPQSVTKNSGTSVENHEITSVSGPGNKSKDMSKLNTSEVVKYSPETSLVLGVVLQQMLINKGLKRFGDRAKAAGIKEMSQIHERAAITPVDWDNLSEKERDGLIDSLLLIEKKNFTNSQ